MNTRDQLQDGATSPCDRVVVFADSSSSHAQLMTTALLSAARDVEDFSIAAVVDTGTVGYSAFLWSCVMWLVIRLFNPTSRKARPCSPRRLRQACRVFAVPYRAVGNGDPNECDVAANLMVSIYCLRRFSAAFLQKFDFTVNYHNGRLPAYRGLLATNWELYRSEPTFGFTFHEISPDIDEGSILIAGAVSGDGRTYKHQVEMIKTLAAVKRWPEVIDKMKRRERGIPQSGPAGSYSRRKLLAIREIADPASVTLSDLERRIRCFELVNMRFRERTLPVSAIERTSGRSRFGFVTADGTSVRATRFDHLPYPLYRLGGLFRRIRVVASASGRRLKTVIGLSRDGAEGS